MMHNCVIYMIFQTNGSTLMFLQIRLTNPTLSILFRNFFTTSTPPTLTLTLTLNPHYPTSRYPSICLLLSHFMPLVISQGLVVCVVSAFMPLIPGGMVLDVMTVSSSIQIHPLRAYKASTLVVCIFFSHSYMKTPSTLVHLSIGSHVWENHQMKTQGCGWCSQTFRMECTMQQWFTLIPFSMQHILFLYMGKTLYQPIFLSLTHLMLFMLTMSINILTTMLLRLHSNDHWYLSFFYYLFSAWALLFHIYFFS